MGVAETGRLALRRCPPGQLWLSAGERCYRPTDPNTTALSDEENLHGLALGGGVNYGSGNFNLGLDYAWKYLGVLGGTELLQRQPGLVDVPIRFKCSVRSGGRGVPRGFARGPDRSISHRPDGAVLSSGPGPDSGQGSWSRSPYSILEPAGGSTGPGDYPVAVRVRDSTGLTLFQQAWQSRVNDVSVRDAYAVEIVDFAVAPGTYRLDVEVRDSTSGHTARAEAEAQGALG